MQIRLERVGDEHENFVPLVDEKVQRLEIRGVAERRRVAKGGGGGARI